MQCTCVYSFVTHYLIIDTARYCKQLFVSSMVVLQITILCVIISLCSSFVPSLRVTRSGALLFSAIRDSLLPQQLYFSENAMNRVRKLLSEQEGSKILRVSLSGGGDDGDYIEWKYCLEFDDVAVIQDKDKYALFQNEDWRYVVEKQYLPLIANCKIDYIDDIFKGGFKFLNPQATGTCGCAASFTTDTDRKFINNVLTKDNK